MSCHTGKSSRRCQAQSMWRVADKQKPVVQDYLHTAAAGGNKLNTVLGDTKSQGIRHGVIMGACLVPEEQMAAVAAGGDELVLRARECDALDRLRVAVPCDQQCARRMTA